MDQLTELMLLNIGKALRRIELRMDAMAGRCECSGPRRPHPDDGNEFHPYCLDCGGSVASR